jgi:AcrR family transcriptional regulator
MSANSEEPRSGTTPPRPLDRRARRRQDTINEIIDIAVEVMSEQGVNGLSVAEVARRLGVQPPSLYKYFPSLIALYDALFRRGFEQHNAAVGEAMAAAEPGVSALNAGLEAGARWVIANFALGQLMFWRPIPSFEPSPESMAASHEMVALYRGALAEAVATDQLAPEADSDEALLIVSILVAGVMSQQMANEPHTDWDNGRYTQLFPQIMNLFFDAYAARAASSTHRRGELKRPRRDPPTKSGRTR